VPGSAAVTWTETVQLPDAGTVPPASATVVPFAKAVTVPPAHVVVPLGVAVFVTPPGSESVNAAPVKATPFGFVSVIVSVEGAPVEILEGENDLATVGGERTVKVPDPGATFDPPFAVVKAPAGIVFVYVPATAALTLTVTRQFPEAGIVPLKSDTVVPLAAAVTEPPAQVVAPPGAAVVVTPAGSVSVKDAPVNATALEFASVIVRTEELPSPTVLGANAFVTVGGFRTARVADAGLGLLIPSASTTEFAGMVFV
jgi:hypothetical protein